MFIAALVTIATLWKQLRCPMTDEGTKKMWYIYNTMEFYLAIKKNEIMLFAGKWMELENLMLSEVSQAQKSKVTYFPSYVEAHMCIYRYIHIYSERQNKIVLVSLSEGTMGGRKGKENVRMKNFERTQLCMNTI
jgi:hypothetical protein